MADTFATILAGYNTYNISAAVETMTNLGYTDDQMAEVLQREFPDAGAQSIRAALVRVDEARDAAEQLMQGNDLNIGDIPVAPNICAGASGGAECRFIVTVHLCTYQNDGTQRWETVVIDTDQAPDPGEIDNTLRDMVRTGEGLSYPSVRTGQGTVQGALCGYDIISVFRSY